MNGHIVWMLVVEDDAGRHFLRRWDGKQFQFDEPMTPRFFANALTRAGHVVEVVEIDLDTESPNLN